MDIVVVGAGIVGLSTAYQLRARGHRVCVLERAAQCAAGASHANAGQLSYAYVAPLAGPGVLGKLPGWLLDPDGPVRLSVLPRHGLTVWLGAFLAACNGRASDATTRSLLRLSMLSRAAWHDFLNQHPGAFPHRRNGKLIVHRHAAGLDAALRLRDALAPYGYPLERLEAEACVALEPALRGIAHELAGGVFTRAEESGDCRAACEALAQELARDGAGGEVRYGVEVRDLVLQNSWVRGVRVADGTIAADAVVLANGLDAGVLARHGGVALRLAPLKGYSLSYGGAAPPEDFPSVSVTDYDRKIAYARIGATLRAAGLADLAGANHAIDARRAGLLRRQVEESFPALKRHAAPHVWAGLRPATPSGRPYIGATRIGNLFLNAGHGALGFTLSMGSAVLLADLIDARRPAIGAAAFAPLS